MNKVRWSLSFILLAAGCDDQVSPSNDELLLLAEPGQVVSELATPRKGRRVDAARAFEIAKRAEGATSLTTTQPDETALWGAGPVEGQFDVSNVETIFDSCGQPGGTPLEAISTVEDVTFNTYSKVSVLLGAMGNPPPFVRDCEYVGSLGWCVDDNVIDFTPFGIDATVTIENTFVDLWQPSESYRSYVVTDVDCEGDACDHPIPSGIFENGVFCSVFRRVDWDRVGDL